MLALSLIVPLLAVAPPAPPRVLVLDVTRSADVSADEAITVGEILTAAVAELDGAEVLSHAELRALTELAANQEEAGCDSSGCLAELAGAMDADYVVSCRVSRLGEVYVANLALFDAASARVDKRLTRQGASVGDVAKKVAPSVGDLFAGTGLRIAAATRSKRSEGRGAGLVLAGQIVLGAAGAAALASVGALAAGEAALSSPSTLTATEYRGRQSIARLSAATGAVVAVVAGVAGGVLLGIGALE